MQPSPIAPLRALVTLAVSFAMLTALASCTDAQEAAPPQTSAEETSSTETSDAPVGQQHGKSTNRLADETSPYLLLHAHNPVDWYPWGPEAFEKAQAENKVIFLSVGYSSCYWCHVMERESFTNPEIAKFLNEHFVCIKVDREERPDVDDIYMTALQIYFQAIGSPQGGGWPMSMFLTPQARPIAGGTYFPPNSVQGRPGFLQVAQQIHDLWSNREQDLRKTADTLTAELQRITERNATAESVSLDQGLVDAAVDAVADTFDPKYGGIGFNTSQPDTAKFPSPPKLELLQRMISDDGEQDLANIVDTTLTRMADGGIYDHLGGGFHRYSTDRKWLVPHFEKMLYDNAQLADLYLAEYVRTGNERYREVTEATLEFILRDLHDPAGGFYSALDAETDGVEGQFYVWTKEEIREVLGEDDAAVFAKVYGLDLPEFFEHGYVLHFPKPLADAAQALETSPRDLKARLTAMREKLLATRNERKALLRDDKVLTSWNGLAIAAFARAGVQLERNDFLQAAEAAADFILDNMRDDEGRLLRTWRADIAKLNAYLDDYAFFIDGLLTLHDVTDDARWLTVAQELTEQQIDRFWDDKGHGFYFTADNHEQLLARTKNAYDSVLPSGNGVSAQNLIRLYRKTEEQRYHDLAEQTLSVFAGKLRQSPRQLPVTAIALDEFLEIDTQTPTSQTVETPSAVVTRTGHYGPRLPRDLGNLTLTGAEVTDSATKPKPKKKVKARIFLPYKALPAGRRVPVVILLDVEKGWHINANPAKPDFMIPTELTVSSKQQATLSGVRYPNGQDFKSKDLEETLSVYEGRVILTGHVLLPEKAAGGTDQLEFEVRYQACNDSKCLRPSKVTIGGQIPIAQSGSQLEPVNVKLFQAIATQQKAERATR